MAQTEAVLEVARRYAAAGLSVIPVRADGSKAAACKWGEFEDRAPTAEELAGWFAPERPVGLAVVCGKVSGNLAVLDFESNAAWEKWHARLVASGWLAWIAGCPLVRTPKGGRHLYCRLEEGWVAGGKLAMAAKNETVIEVRGQGHYVLAPGCPAACHPLNVAYLSEADGWLSADAPPGTVTLDQFGALCDLAREQNQYVPPERVRSAASAPSDAKGDRPGDEFNRRAAWAEVLEPHGWTVDRTSGEVTYWTRPGKKLGCSATSGHCRSECGGDLLYVFTPNAAPFEMQTAYDKFGAVAQLDHAGDLSAAAKALRAAGYGRNDPAALFGPVSAVGTDAERPEDGVVPDFEFATNADLKRLDLGVKWVWERWLQVGSVNLLAAEGGAGKTRFVADLCRRVHCSLPWPDGQPAGAWDGQFLAMWVAGDRNHGELVTLSETFGFGDRISYSGSKNDPLGGVTLQASADFQTLYRRVKAARPLFLVIDTAGGSTGFNLSKQEEARSFFAPLSDIAVRLGLCVIVITHLNATKNVLGKRAEERVRCVIRMSSADRKPETPRRIEVVKSNSLQPEPIGMRLGPAGNEYDKTPPPSPEDQAQGGSVRGAADDPDRGPPTKVRECMDWLEEALDAAPARVSKIRDGAEKAGFNVKALYKAVTALNIIATESQGCKWWALNRQTRTL